MHKKSAHFERFMINDDKSFYHWYAILLADAEMFEDVLENGIGRDFAYDVGEVMDTFAEVLRDEVARETGLHAHLDTFYSIKSRDQGFVVTEVGHDDIFRRTLREICDL